MKSIWYVVFLLGALLVVSSIDAIPDPPAVNPPSSDVKAPCFRELPSGVREPRLTCDATYTSLHITIRRIDLEEITQPYRPSEGIALTGHAADPSPPRYPHA
jgi:hypothetical protein